MSDKDDLPDFYLSSGGYIWFPDTCFCLDPQRRHVGRISSDGHGGYLRAIEIYRHNGFEEDLGDDRDFLPGKTPQEAVENFEKHVKAALAGEISLASPDDYRNSHKGPRGCDEY